MEKNSETCSHCKGRLVKLSERTPLINRTDGKTFHLTLFSGPYRRGIKLGDLNTEVLICTFTYVHDRIGPNNEHVAVTIARADSTQLGADRQVNAVADKLAGLIQLGRKLDHDYHFEKGQLEPGKK
jgi:hypothetical protein